MTNFKVTFFYLFLLCQYICAQSGTVTNLQEVLISDQHFKKHAQSQSVLKLNDSVIASNGALLTQLLNFNSSVYFKEYGRGMLSTVAFRGTTAAQTAVVWNGININSQINGSTDFNTISTTDYSNISLKAGGGSLLYGSGAIGGSVHLNNDLVFSQPFENTISLGFGSFNTQSMLYKGAYANDKWSIQIGFSKNSSTNDYKYLDRYTWKGEQRYNENGNYRITTFNTALAYKINANNSLKLYSQNSNTNRNNALLTEYDTKTSYKNGFSRNLLEYSANFGAFTTNIKTAFITENYQYYPNIDRNDYSFGETQSFINKVDLGYRFSKATQLDVLLDYTKTKGFGSGLNGHERQIGSAAVILHQYINSYWETDLGIRKEVTNDYQSPLLFNLGSTYRITHWYLLKLNLSRNFRIPTFNDLYWQEGGNINLKPERSYQSEVGNVFTFKSFSISQFFYYLNITDLLQWMPGKVGIWSPLNTEKVNSYGAETQLNYFRNFGKNNFNVTATYAYTASKDAATNKQLFFVPYHKATAALAYSRNNFTANVQVLYNGFVYTRSNNDPSHIIHDYTLTNIGFTYDLDIIKNFKIGFQISNLLNKAYESLEDRPMPGRFYTMNLIYKL